MSVLKALARRRFASGGAPQVGISDPRANLTATPTDDEATGRQYHPLADADYYTYGQDAPEHQFFTGKLPVAPLQPNNLPTASKGSSEGSGGGAGILGDITQLLGTAKNAGALAKMAGYDNQYTQAMQNPLGAAKDYLGYLGANSALSGAGSGALANGALTDAGFGAGWTTPALDLGAGAAGAGAGVSAAGSALGASGASAAAGAGAGSLGGGTLASVTGSAIPSTVGEAVGAGTGAAGGAGAGAAGASGLGASLAASGISTALPLAAVGWAIADKINAPGKVDKAKEAAVSDAMAQSGWNMAAGPNPRVAYNIIKSPDGQYFNIGNNDNFKAYARAVTEKAPQSQIQAAWEKFLKENLNTQYKGHARGGRSLETGSPGILHYATQDPKFNGTVRGKGTGRSDEIPARLSDGEYVMDAETVAMLGDGSTDAGAEKLDQMRAKLRAHKGKKLAKGKFSDNAKDPMEYIP